MNTTHGTAASAWMAIAPRQPLKNAGPPMASEYQPCTPQPACQAAANRYSGVNNSATSATAALRRANTSVRINKNDSGAPNDRAIAEVSPAKTSVLPPNSLARGSAASTSTPPSTTRDSAASHPLHRDIHQCVFILPV